MTLNGHTNSVHGLAFAPDGKRLASVSLDSTAKVWDLASSAEITTFSGHTSPVWLTDVTFSPDGRFIFTGGDDDFVRQWDAGTGQEIRTFSGDGKDIYGIALAQSRLTRELTDEECRKFLHAESCP